MWELIKRLPTYTYIIMPTETTMQIAIDISHNLHGIRTHRISTYPKHLNLWLNIYFKIETSLHKTLLT